MTSPNQDALWTLGSQVASIGATALGINVTPAQLDGAAALIRTLTGAKKAPAHEEIKTAIVSGTGSPAAAETIAGLVPAIKAAMAKGVPSDIAIETTAVKLNAEAARNRLN